MKIIILALIINAVMLLSPSAHAQSAHLSLDFGGDNRSYVLHTPAGYSPSKRYPLMMVFHGTNGTGAGMEEMTGFDAVADQYGFFVVYPDSIGAKWKLNGSNNDISFNLALLQTLEHNYAIDPTRVYVAGHSQGGGMAQALACLNTDKFAGLAVVSENLNKRFESLCHPSRTISVVLFHGTDDPVSPYAGGSNYAGGETYSAQQTAEFWSHHDGCTSMFSTKGFENKLSDGTSQPGTAQIWNNCLNAMTVAFYTIPGGGHTWPGNGRVKNEKLGASSLTLNASQIIWQTLSPYHN